MFIAHDIITPGTAIAHFLYEFCSQTTNTNTCADCNFALPARKSLENLSKIMPWGWNRRDHAVPLKNMVC
jgi:hypothetical protein